jgi:hypothetical protein
MKLSPTQPQPPPRGEPLDVPGASERIDADPHHHAWLGRWDREPLFLTETYDPLHSELAGHYPVRTGDVGMHVLIGPPRQEPVSGLTSAVMRTVMEFLFSDPANLRVVVEPDVRNRAIAAKNALAGFVAALAELDAS